jgi:ADP-dependent NAD(P)H-hydrate dehydratase / NAD(P)H-hydrate epimerase
MNLVTAAQMRDYDQKVIRHFGVPGILLMEAAAQRVAEAIRKRYSPLRGARITVVCGKGNNGGDGIAVARQLATRDSANVILWLVEPMDQASPDAAINLMIARNYGIPIETVSDPDRFNAHLSASTLIVDAILGTGIDGDPRPAAAVAINCINQAQIPVVSIDIPSGLNSDNGEAGNPTVKATLTVTLAMPKLGLYLYPGAALAGELETVDIGFPKDIVDDPNIRTIAATGALIAEWLPERKPGRDSNKGKFGNVAIFAGSPGFLGSACLASEGAARAGAGLVTLVVPESIFNAAMIKAPATVMTQFLPSLDDGSFTSNVDEAIIFTKSRTSIGFGCGVGHGDEISLFAKKFIEQCEKPMVLDADVLTILSKETDHGESLIKGRKFPTVLTPHPGEMARLLGITTEEVQADRLNAVRDAAIKFGAVVVLKGQATLVADPDGRLAVNTTGNPGMATGGSGDVLTGITTTLLSQIDDPWKATVAAVFLHGLAGDRAAKELGAAGIIATDICDRLPAAIASCYE